MGCLPTRHLGSSAHRGAYAWPQLDRVTATQKSPGCWGVVQVHELRIYWHGLVSKRIA